jgi:hypothetical protein
VDSITAVTKQNADSVQLSADSLAGLLRAVNSVAESRSKADIRRRLQGRSLAGNASASAVIGVDTTAGVLNNFGELVASNMLPGQNATDLIQSEFRMSVQVLASSAVTGSRSVAVTVPQTPLEKYLGQATSQVAVPAADGVSLVTSSLRAAQYDSLGEELQGNPLSIYSSGSICASAPCKVRVVMQNSQAIDFAELNSGGTEYKTVTCAVDEQTTRTFTCGNGESVTLSCTGVAGTVEQQCPVITYASVCSSLDAAAGSVLTGQDSGCRAVSFTPTAVTCECDMYHNRARRLSTSGGNFTAPAGYSVSYVGMLGATSESFVSTIRTADDLNAGTVAKGWRALATLGSLAAAIMVGLFWSHHADFKMKKIAPAEEGANKQTPSSLAAVKAAAKADKKKGAGKKIRFNSRAKKALVSAELAIVEDSLPKALSSRTFSDRFLEEVKQHHRWFGIVFYYSDAFPRVLRVTSLATNAIVMLFIQSITYNLTNPDDGSCALMTTEEQCLAPQSPFATGESMCSWTPSNSASTTTAAGTCAFIEPDNSMRIILFVAIFCAIVTTPIALTADWVMQNILSAQTLVETPAETALAAVPADSLMEDTTPAGKDGALTSIVPNGGDRNLLRRRSSGAAQLRSYLGIFNDERKIKEDKKIMANSRAELMMLSMKLKRYREGLRPDELEEFNSKSLVSSWFSDSFSFLT